MTDLEGPLLKQIIEQGTSWSKIQRWTHMKSGHQSKRSCRICKKSKRGHLYSTCRGPLIVRNSPANEYDEKETEYDLFDFSDFDIESFLTLDSMTDGSEPMSHVEQTEQTTTDGTKSIETVSYSENDDIMSLSETEVFNELETLDDLSCHYYLQLILENSKAIDQLRDQTEHLSQEFAASKNMTFTKVTDNATNLISSRKVKTPSQTKILLECYEQDTHPSMTRKQTLASDLNLSLKQVNDWFTNHRKRSK